MMEHIRQYDWCSSQLDTEFVIEEDLDNCVTEKILRNKFHDPLASSDSEDEVNNKINWDEVFTKKKDVNRFNNMFVPVLRSLPQYPKLSALNSQQHYQCLKVLCGENPNILKQCFIPRPTKSDHKVFEQVSEIYKKEQKEYIEWAKAQWVNGHCIRALRPKPAIETLYEAEFKMRAHEMKSFPKTYSMAAQIPLSMRSANFEITHQKDLIQVNISELPQIEYPTDIAKKLTILRPAANPEPCTKHPCRFIVPGESSMTVLPLTEVHRELAHYAAENGAEFIASESALRCIVEVRTRTWTLPISVCETIGPDGEKFNVVVLGSECPIEKETAQIRTYKAYRHLLEYAVIPPQEKAKMLDKIDESRTEETDNTLGSVDNFMGDMNDSDDENCELFIDTGEIEMDTETNAHEDKSEYKENDGKNETSEEIKGSNQSPKRKSIIDALNVGVYNCTCKDTIFERPPRRSFRKWKVVNGADRETYDIIIHSSHKVRQMNEEVILEPIPEYQLDMGASEMQQSRIDSLSLSLMLRQNASLLNVRVEGSTGEVGTFDMTSSEEWKQRHPDSRARGTERIVSAMSQLRTLVPGHYLLHHKPSHGENAMLYAARAGAAGDKLTLSLENALLEVIDEAKGVATPPTLSPALLPWHKFRKILPCAFTPHENQVAKEPKKPVTKQKMPPQAIKLGEEGNVAGERGKWPKRKRNKRKKKDQK